VERENRSAGRKMEIVLKLALAVIVLAFAISFFYFVVVGFPEKKEA